MEQKLIGYYENPNLNQHNANHFLKANLKLKRISNLLLFTNHDDVLDVGCSSGHILSTISPVINRGRGVDISRTIIGINIKNNNFSNISFSNFDGMTLNLSDKYNKVLLLDALEHAFYPDKLITTIKNVMTPEGLLIVEVPFTGFLSELIFGEYHQGHLRYYDPDYLLYYFKNAGFEIIKVKTYNSVPFALMFIKFPMVFQLLNFIVNLIPSKIYPYFGGILIIVKNK